MSNAKISKEKLLEQITIEIIKGKNLPLYRERVKNRALPVIGEGSFNSKIMFIGEAPGKNEAIIGKPFCGASGRILDELFASVGIRRKNVYITNIMKDRPPINRDPHPGEVKSYGTYLDRQIEIIKPKIIATLGRFSMSYIMNKFSLGSEIKIISQVHGRLFNAESIYGPVKVIPLYHPAVAVYNSNMKETLKEDFKVLKRFK